MAGPSSLASLSQQLEESRARQLQERSSQALQLMRTAVEWKSWEELRTLTRAFPKAFQRYLEEIRETDLQRRGDIQASPSRVCAMDQLASVQTHKKEATEQVAKLSPDNAELRRQLEFDARQFVALLQSCASLEKQLAALRKSKEREAAPEMDASGVLGCRDADVSTEQSSLAPLPASRSDPGDVRASSSKPLRRRAADVAAAEAKVHEGAPDECDECGDTEGPCTATECNDCNEARAGLELGPAEKLSPSPKQAAASPSASPHPSDASPATIVASVDVDLPTASPGSQAQPVSETPPSKQNQRLLQGLRDDALGVLQRLAAVKQQMSQANAALRAEEPSPSRGDGTPALKDPASPENGQDDDSTSTAMDSGTSRSSGGGNAHAGDAGSRIPLAEDAPHVAMSPRPGARPCDVASPLRPSALAAAEAARWAKACVRGADKAVPEVKHVPPPVPTFWEPVTSEPRTAIATESSIAQALVSNGMLVTPTKLTSSPSRTAVTGVQPERYMLSPDFQAVHRPCIGPTQAGSPIRSVVRSQVWAGPPQSPLPCSAPTPPDSAERQTSSFKQLPAVPPLPCPSPRSPREASAPGPPAPKRAASSQKPGLRGLARGGRSDASYVATIQLVRELNNGNVPAATSASGPPVPYKGVPQKEVQMLTRERAKRREAPMSREGEVPARNRRQEPDGARSNRPGSGSVSSPSTKASL